MSGTGATKPGAGKTVIVGAVRYAELCGSGRDLLVRNGFRLIENDSTVPWTPEQIGAVIGTADAAVAGVEVYDASVMARAERLRIISRLGVGLDNVDLAAARDRDIDVVNVPGGNAAAVAELAIGFMIASLRRMTDMDRAAKAGRWDRFVGHELAGKSVALVGFGAISRMVARRLSGFDVDLVAYDPYADAAVADALGVRLVDTLPEAVAEAHIVSVHAPHTAKTHHTVDDRLIGAMRPGVIIVNTSRGGLVDEEALLRGLESGKVAGAGLDVFEVEPVAAGHPLLSHPAVVCSPHAAADSYEAYERIGLATAQAIVDVFSGRTPSGLANPLDRVSV
jgi:D-3-phosphoglycerate dehydrogenase